VYLGPRRDPDAALATWLAGKDDPLAGRVRRPKSDGFTVRDLANVFMTSPERRLEMQESTATEIDRIRQRPNLNPWSAFLRLRLS
jgi:hypothetical protein